MENPNVSGFEIYARKTVVCALKNFYYKKTLKLKS